MGLHLMALAATLLSGPATQGEVQSTTGARPLGFSALSTRGRRVFIRDLVQDGSAFLYFIRYGDATNDEFARQLSRIVEQYPEGRAKWYGVINSDQSRANAWMAEFKPSYEILMDGSLTLVQLYGVESSPTVVHVGRDGEVLGHWAGYSGFRLKQINEAAAKANQVDLRYVDFQATPSVTRYGVNYILRREG